MKKLTNIKDYLFTHASSKNIYLFSDIVFMLVHFLFIFCFKYLGVNEMVFFNIGSVTIYAILAVLIYKVKDPTPIICVALIEIVTHAVLATVYVGWLYGFAMYIVCAVPIPFFLNFKRDYLAYAFSLSMVTVFAVLKAVTSGDNHVIYQLDNLRAQTVFYIMNSLFSFILIIAISAVYRAFMRFSHLRLKAQNEKLTKLATVDPLTQLFNRRAMMDFLKTIHEQSRKSGAGYTIAMCDIDNFKMVNDNYGHDCGDAALIGISSIIASTVPAEGYVCRWGGEEILFVIPNSSLQKATDIAEKIRSALENKSFEENGSQFNITATFGVCECSGTQSYEKAISTADKYLYCGKQKGKNCVVNKFIFDEINQRKQ